MKTQIHNLIILDESGSMSSVCSQTISGCNETINTIISAARTFADTQDHYISIFAFQSGSDVPSRYIVKNVPALAAKHITHKDYSPWGGTPLYDAIGATLTDLKAATKNDRMAMGNVTIITDGEENSSRHYSLPRVAAMIKELKEMGWSFNFIGANIDVKAAAASLNIDNSLEFAQDEEGTKAMFARENASRRSWLGRCARVMDECAPSASMSAEQEIEYRSKLREASKSYFEDEA